MSVRKGHPYYYGFAAIDSAARPTRKTGISWIAGDVQVSKDAGGYVNAANLPSELGTTGRYVGLLATGETNADLVMIKITKAGMDDVDIIILTGGHKTGTVVTDAGNTATTFKTDLTEAATDYWKDTLLMFVSSAGLLHQVKKVTAFNFTTDFITVSGGFTAAPAAGDRFILIDI